MKKLKFKKRFSGFCREENGVVLVVVALAMTALLSMAALAVDAGVVYYQRSNLQTALDAAALAAVQELDYSGELTPEKAVAMENAAALKAQEYMVKNGFSADEISVIEFSEDYSTVRVLGQLETKTFFANIFNTSVVGTNEVAAAKYINESVDLDFDHLLFTGNPDFELFLGGTHFEVAGSAHANGTINASPSTAYESFIENLEAVGNVELYGVTYANQVVPAGSLYNVNFGTIQAGTAHEEMPDFTEAIQAIYPYVGLTAMPTVSTLYTINSNSVPAYLCYTDNYQGDSGIVVPNSIKLNSPSNSFDSGWNRYWFWNNIYINCKKATFQRAAYFNENVYVNGDFVTNGNGVFYVRGNLYVNGNLTLKAWNGWTIRVDGNIYVNGNLNVGGSRFTSNGDVFVNGSATFDGPTFINGNLSCGGNISFGGSTVYIDAIRTGVSVVLNGGIIRSKGDVTFTNGCYLSGCIFATKSINCGGNNTYVDSSEGKTLALYSETQNINFYAANSTVYGMIYAPNGSVTLAGGTLTFYGNIIGDKISGVPATLIMGENPRSLPFSVYQKHSVLVE